MFPKNRKGLSRGVGVGEAVHTYGVEWGGHEVMFARRAPSAPGIQINVLAIYPNALPPNITPSSSPGTLSTTDTTKHKRLHSFIHLFISHRHMPPNRWAVGNQYGEQPPPDAQTVALRAPPWERGGADLVIIGGNLARRAWRADVPRMTCNTKHGDCFEGTSLSFCGSDADELASPALRYSR